MFIYVINPVSWKDSDKTILSRKFQKEEIAFHGQIIKDLYSDKVMVMCVDEDDVQDTYRMLDAEGYGYVGQLSHAIRAIAEA